VAIASVAVSSAVVVVFGAGLGMGLVA